MLDHLLPLVGIFVMIAISLAFSTNRKAALKRWDLIAWGFGLQLICALIVLKTKAGNTFFSWFNDAFVALTDATQEGSRFLFGPLLDVPKTGFVWALQILPTIIFFSALTSILYHLGILQFVVKIFAWLMQKTLKTSGAETLSASANIFVGQTEAPLMVKPYVNRMTQSELMTVMTGGFATVAGGVMASYVLMLKDAVPGIAGHLLAASIMSAPAALVFGKLFVPETEKPETADTLHVAVEKESVNIFDAATIGTRDGLLLALNVGAMLLSFLAIIKLIDLLLLHGATAVVGQEHLPAWWNLQGIMGHVFSPFAYMLGISDWHEATKVGELLGIKMVANEFVAYGKLAEMVPLGDGGATAVVAQLSPRARIIATYALCGFANFGSIGIQIGGLAIMGPDRRADLSRLGFRAMIAGTFACNATACVAALLL